MGTILLVFGGTRQMILTKVILPISQLVSFHNIITQHISLIFPFFPFLFMLCSAFKTQSALTFSHKLYSLSATRQAPPHIGAALFLFFLLLPFLVHISCLPFAASKRRMSLRRAGRRAPVCVNEVIDGVRWCVSASAMHVASRRWQND